MICAHRKKILFKRKIRFQIHGTLRDGLVLDLFLLALVWCIFHWFFFLFFRYVSMSISFHYIFRENKQIFYFFKKKQENSLAKSMM